ncbi:MAG: hypothetical protein DYH03_03595 [Nitrospira sp. NTP1]|nr:hypothetical protein [Nitrospira sp. NTP1]
MIQRLLRSARGLRYEHALHGVRMEDCLDLAVHRAALFALLEDLLIGDMLCGQGMDEGVEQFRVDNRCGLFTHSRRGADGLMQRFHTGMLLGLRHRLGLMIGVAIIAGDIDRGMV